MRHLPALFAALLFAQSSLAAPPTDADRELFATILRGISHSGPGLRTDTDGKVSHAERFSRRIQVVLWPLPMHHHVSPDPRIEFDNDRLTESVALNVNNINQFTIRDMRLNESGDLAHIVGEATLSPMHEIYAPGTRPNDGSGQQYDRRAGRHEVRVRLVKEWSGWKIDRIDAGPLDADAKTCGDRRREPAAAYDRTGSGFISSLSGRIVEVTYRDEDTLVILRESAGDWCLSLPPRVQLASMGIDADALQIYRELRVSVRLHRSATLKALVVPAILGP